MPPVPPAKPEFPKFVDSLWCVYIVSVVAAWNAEFITYPLDLIKTRLQIQGELNKNGEKVPYRGMFQTAVGIGTEEGIHKLWQGVHAAFIRHLIYSGTRIITYKALKENAFKQNAADPYFPLWKSAICGVSAGAFAQYIASPTDLLKVQLQMEGRRRLMGLPPRVHGLWDAFRQVWSKGGVRGLWKGSVPNVQRAALVNLGDLTTYDLAKRFIMRHTSLSDNHFVHVMASCCAGFVAASMGTPADVIKTRVMNQPLDDRGRGLLYSSSIDCLKKTLQTEGAPALYKGFVPIWMRMAPWSLSFWLTYEEVVSLVGAKSW
ncbi:mitochondrial uncoupling protein 4 isoform X2 [Cylas formicarius]|nr:mitochondrial uncoupling protein 4 isoform X2 [Cylas formicarius]XP_060522016.1 mitochondrial uncoupling protein 4 isoform X2 [Cylas formicarius]